MDTRGPWELAGEDADRLLVGLSCTPWSCQVPEAGTIPSHRERGPWGPSSLLGPHGLSCPSESVFMDHRTTDTPSFVDFLFLSVLIFTSLHVKPTTHLSSRGLIPGDPGRLCVCPGQSYLELGTGYPMWLSSSPLYDHPNTGDWPG